MEILQIFIPLFCLFYSIYKLSRSPIYASLFPLVYSFGRSLFIPSQWDQLALPFVSLTINYEDLTFILLIIAWVFIRQKKKEYKPISAGSDLILLVIFFAIILIQFPVFWLGGNAVHPSSIFISRIYFYFIFSLLIWVDIFRRFTRSEVWHFIGEVSLITTLLMPFYMLSAIGFNIYPFDSYQQILIGSTLVIRDFVTFPIWTKIAFIYYGFQLMQARFNPATFFAFSILVIGIFLTLSRSIIIVFLVMAGLLSLVYLYRIIKNPQLARTAIIIFLFVSGFGISSSLLFEKNFNLALDRFNTAYLQGLNEPNILIRTTGVNDAINLVANIDPVFGAGLPGLRTSGFVNTIVINPGDMLWVQIIVDLGFSGSILFSLFLLISFFNSISMAFKDLDSRYPFGIFCLLLLIWDIGRTFVSGELIWYVACKTLPLALIMVAKRDLFIDTEIPVVQQDVFISPLIQLKRL